MNPDRSRCATEKSGSIAYHMDQSSAPGSKPGAPFVPISSLLGWPGRIWTPVGVEEPLHLAASIRPARVGVGPGRAAIRPGVASSMKHSLLEDGTPDLVSLDRG